MSDPTAATLQAYLQAAFPQRSVEIPYFERRSTGWESDVYAFDVDWGAEEARDEMILRVYPGDDAQPKSAREYEVIAHLHAAGYPVPRVDLLEQEHSPFGKPFLIMERVEGRTLWETMFTGTEAQGREQMDLFCGLFARLHAMDWRSIVPPELLPVEDGTASLAAMQLARWEPYITGTTEMLPGFARAWEWLNQHAGSTGKEPLSVVHWDFHPANILIRERDGAAFVIDWTGADLTDRRFDIAWTLMLMASVEGAWVREPLLQMYEQHAGRAIEGLEFFDAAACLRRLYSVIVSLRMGAEKMGMRPGAEEAMRRHAPHLRYVHQLLVERTGTAIPEVEQFLMESGA